jgi:carboxypeptidase C (cathepsin A)
MDLPCKPTHLLQQVPHTPRQPLFISGESYACIYVPFLATAIHQYNNNRYEFLYRDGVYTERQDERMRCV